MEEVLYDIKECVLHFNYPLANSMSEGELGDIFHKSNRCFLVSWMLKMFDDAYSSIVSLAENKDNKELLGDLIYELGFCNNGEQLPFMTGELDVNEQILDTHKKAQLSFNLTDLVSLTVFKIPMLNILHKMFVFLKSLKRSSTDENSQPVSMEEISSLSKNRINLFPMYGDFKISGSTELDEISNSQSDSESDTALVNEVHDDLGVLKEKLLEYLPKLEVAGHNLSKDNKTASKENIVFHSGSADTFRICSDNLKIVSQFVQDVKTIKEFSNYKDSTSCEKPVARDESVESLKVLCGELFITLKHQQMK